MALTDKLKAIADAIRSKTGSTESMSLDGMATEISNISTGGSIEEPYVIETYDSAGNLIEAELVGHTKIRDNFFYACSKLALISLPSGVTIIGNSVFYNCSNLTSITIPDSVTSFGDWAFYNCTSLTDVYYTGTVAQWNVITKGSENRLLTNATIHYNYVP